MTSRFHITRAPIAGVAIVERRPVRDPRGYFERIFCDEELKEIGWTKPVRQINHTYTARRGAVRGMHFQHPPHCETKLVLCLRGVVMDVAVDLRAGSTTLFEWHGEVLSPENCKSLLIPEGCAHGYQCLTEDVELMYLHSEAYAAHAEDGVHPADPRFTFAWPLPIAELSAKDAARAFLPKIFTGIVP